jgi:hypothetical protein
MKINTIGLDADLRAGGRDDPAHSKTPTLGCRNQINGSVLK